MFVNGTREVYDTSVKGINYCLTVAGLFNQLLKAPKYSRNKPDGIKNSKLHNYI
jgi:hypothetical protein